MLERSFLDIFQIPMLEEQVMLESSRFTYNPGREDFRNFVFWFWKACGKCTEFYHSGELDSAIYLGKKFIDKNTESDTIYALLGSSFLKKGEYDKAEEFAKKSLELNEDNHIALATMGILLDEMNEYEKASKFYKRSLEAYPIPQTYSNFSENRIRVSDYKMAVKLGEKAVRLSERPGDKAVLCIAYHKTGSLEKRDSLYKELKRAKYDNLDDLSRIIKR